MANRNKIFTLNRKDYNRIRKMDHFQMSQWAESVYKFGYKDGFEEAGKDCLDIDQVRCTLYEIKGIGAKRVAEIIEALERRNGEKTIDGNKG